MTAQKSQLLAVSTFAKMIGVSRQAVQQWIANEKLTRGRGLGKTAKKKPAKVNPVKAAQELLETLDFSKTKPDLQERLENMSGKKIEEKIEVPEEENPEKPTDELTLTEAKRRHEIVKVKIKEAELEEKMKRLVNAEEMRKRFFDYGVEIRKALKHVPSKVVDDVRASETRNEGLLIIDKAIDEALQKIVDIEKRKLK